MKRSIWLSIFVLLACANDAFAGAAVSCENKGNSSNWDYSDAGNGYGVACHQTDYWQRLGDNWDTDVSGDADVVGSDDPTDDGVTWRTSSDGGLTWTDFNSTNTVAQGDLVEFRYEFNRINGGWHLYDELKSWIDWDQSTSWDNDDEVIENVRWYKDQDSNDQDLWINHYGSYYYANNHSAYKNFCQNYGYKWNGDAKKCNSNDLSRVYIKQVEVPLTAALGETWLRARVVCENSLTNYSNGMLLDSTGFHDQGEVEDYAITITAKRPPTSVVVSEPAGIALFSSTLMLLGMRRRKLAP